MISKILYCAIALLTLDSLLEMAFIATTVGWLHETAGKGFAIHYPKDGQFLLAGKPLNFLLNQGHAANGSAGTGYIVIGAGGLLALWLRHRSLKRAGSIRGFTSFFYNFWLVFTVLSSIYALASLIYMFVLTYQHDKQSINLRFASTLGSRPYPNTVPYPRQTWTPQGWFPAVLDLPLLIDSQRSDIKTHLTIMRAWQWNMIPMVLLNFAVSILAFIDRRKYGGGRIKSNGKRHAYGLHDYTQVPNHHA